MTAIGKSKCHEQYEFAQTHLDRRVPEHRHSSRIE